MTTKKQETECPKCHGEIEFYGLGEYLKKGNPTGNSSPTFRCVDCDSLFTEGDRSRYSADETYLDKKLSGERLKKEDIEKKYNTTVDIPKAGEPISFFGDFIAILYEIDGQPFIYEAKSDYPSWAYYPGKNGGCFIIWGGKMLWDLGGKIKNEIKCKCGGNLIMDNVEGGKINYHCTKCREKKFENSKTKDPELFEIAKEYAETFNMKEMTKMMKAQIDLPENGDYMIYCGPCNGIVYRSDKEGKKGQHYIHRTGEDDTKEGDAERPHWAYYPGKHGGCILVWGGAMRVDLKGENPRHDMFPGWLVN